MKILTKVLKTLAVSLLIFSGLAQAMNPKVNPEDYPSLDAKQIGMVRHLVRTFNQPYGEWKWLECEMTCGKEDDEYTLQFHIGVNALAVANYHYVPAYRELYQGAIDGAIQKSLHPESWDYWYDQSQATDHILAGKDGPAAEGFHDPVVKYHAWYPSAINGMLAVYATLFDDLKYDEPGAIDFFWLEPIGQMTLDDINKPKAEYSWTDLNNSFLDQLKESEYLGVGCFEDSVWVVCNQGSLWSLKAYDHKHGTNYAESNQKKWVEAWRQVWVDVPSTEGSVELAPSLKNGTFPVGYLPNYKQFTTIDPVPTPHYDGWLGYQMNSWAPELIGDIYPLNKKHWLNELSDGTATVHFKEEDATFTIWLAKNHHGHFAAFASEMGDHETVDKLIAFAEKYKKPVWDDGAYYFEPIVDTFYDENGNFVWAPRAETMSLTFAALNLKDGNGLSAIYNEPWDKKHFAKPYISKVQYPEVIVSQARYVDEKDTLIVTVQPGTEYEGKTSFLVNQLDASKKYKVIKDGKTVGMFNRGKVKSGKGAKVLKREDKRTLRISTDITKKHTFLVQAM